MRNQCTRWTAVVIAWTCLARSALAQSEPAADATPAEFGAQARAIYRVVACAGNDALLPNIDAATVAAYCDGLQAAIEKYRANYTVKAESYIAALRPDGLPTTVIYPFGGGDLISALTTYPDATEVTTISLELSGDPRRIAEVDRKQLAASLRQLRGGLAGLLMWNDSKSVTLSKQQRGELPGELSYFMVGLALHGYEPVGLRYFTIRLDGTLHYLTNEEITTADHATAKQLKKNWTPPDFSPAFANAELTFKKVGAGPDAPLRVHRHVAWNLDNDHLPKDAPLLKHLALKGPVSTMTKAASYLLWRDAFSNIRDYLLANMVFMISDSTGIPGQYVQPAGFIQDTYGTFEGSFLGASRTHNDAFRKLWKSNPHRDLPFRYGYLDSSRQFHLLITRRPSAAP